MALKKIVLPAVALTALMTTSAITGVAYAQKGTVFSPASDWSVLDVVDPAAANKSYCAAAKRYKPGSILTLARNQQNEMSLAIDFQGAQFNPSQFMEVILDPGAGQQRVYDINPASDKAFVVRFGHDESFFDALSRTGMLRVEFEGKSYSFNLAGIDGANELLKDCLVDIRSGDQSAPPVPAKMMDADYSGSEKLDGKVEALKQENARLERLMEEAQQAQSSQGGSKNSGHSLDDLAERLAALENENSRLETQLTKKSRQQETERFDEAHKADPLQGEIENLKAENELLRKNLDGMIATSRDAQDMLRRENSSLQQQLAASMQQNKNIEGTYQQKNVTLESKLNSLLMAQKENAIKGDVVAENAELKEKLDSILSSRSQEQEALRAENESLKQRLEITLKASKSLEDTLRIKNSSLENRLSDFDDESAIADESLRAENEDLKLKLAESLQSGKEIELRLREENAALEEKLNKALNSNLNGDEELRAENESLRERLDANVKTAQILEQTLKSENELLKEKFEKNLQASQDLQERLQAENAALQERIDLSAQTSKKSEESLALELSTLENKYQALLLKLNAAQPSEDYEKVVQDLEATKAELAQTKSENSRLQTELTEKINVGEGDTIAKSEVASRIAELKADNDSLRAELDLIKTAQLELEKIQDEGREKQKTIESLQLEMFKKDESFATLKEQYDTLRDENASLRVKMGMLSEKEQETVALLEKISSLEAENGQLKQQVQGAEALENSLLALKGENAALRQSVEALEKQLNGEQASIEMEQGSQDDVGDENPPLPLQATAAPVAIVAKPKRLDDVAQNLAKEEPSAGEETGQPIILAQIPLEQTMEGELKDELEQAQSAEPEAAIDPAPAQNIELPVLPAQDQAVVGAENLDEAEFAPDAVAGAPSEPAVNPASASAVQESAVLPEEDSVQPEPEAMPPVLQEEAVVAPAQEMPLAPQDIPLPPKAEDVAAPALPVEQEPPQDPVPEQPATADAAILPPEDVSVEPQPEQEMATDEPVNPDAEPQPEQVEAVAETVDAEDAPEEVLEQEKPPESFFVEHESPGSELNMQSQQAASPPPAKTQAEIVKIKELEAKRPKAPEIAKGMAYSSQHNISNIVDTLDPRKPHAAEDAAKNVYIEPSVASKGSSERSVVVPSSQQEAVPQQAGSLTASAAPAQAVTPQRAGGGHGAFLLDRKGAQKPQSQGMNATGQDIVVSTDPGRKQGYAANAIDPVDGLTEAQRYEAGLKARLENTSRREAFHNGLEKDPAVYVGEAQQAPARNPEGGAVYNFQTARAPQSVQVYSLEEAMPQQDMQPPPRQDYSESYAEAAQAGMESGAALTPEVSDEYRAYYQPAFAIQNLLQAARITSGNQVELVQKASDSRKVAYQWNVQDIFGSAEQMAMSDPNQFDALVKQYLEKTQSRCTGDFAVVPDQSIEVHGLRADTYEVACVGGNVNSSASLVFFSKDGTFTSLAHETPTQTMGLAMTLRDKLMSVIKNS